MRIYKMTATFGKLEHETLTLAPGLAVIEAPNEWGKSTWCAFLMAMLYGLDTRAKSTKTALAEKERYAPWSGSPMSGRIDLCWQGRDITIERSTRGRVPLGVFRAYETASGRDIPELTAGNCGQLLLGVERSVFSRSCFIRQSDMPVTKDEALIRRLNGLVTTGDESADGERLARQLRELKNKCRYRNAGLLPRAEEQLAQLEAREAEIASLEAHIRKLKTRISEGKGWLRELENHAAALEYGAAEADAMRIAQVREKKDRTEALVCAMETACRGLPDRAETERKRDAVRALQKQWSAIQRERRNLPELPQLPELPEPFRNLTEKEMDAMVAEDIRRYERLKSAKPWLVWILAGIVLGLLTIPAAVRGWFLLLGAALLGSALLLALGLWQRFRNRSGMNALGKKYGSRHPEQWQRDAQECRRLLVSFDAAAHSFQTGQAELDAKEASLEVQQNRLCGLQTPEQTLEGCEEILRRYAQREQALQEQRRLEEYLQTIQSMAKTAPPPAFADSLSCSREETDRLMNEARQEQQRLLSRLEQVRGRMEALGDPASLQRELEQVRSRIRKLEELYSALCLAQETIVQAQQELQSRFAPRISRRAQHLLSRLTRGRYDRLLLQEDLSLLAGAGQEDVLQEALWRSDGTVDQLYFALRLAVAEELMPEAPLVLDDAFVRFDDDRLKAALDILRQEAEHKQVILFTCQSREKKLL